MGSSKETIQQLNSARDIVLRDPTIYPQVVPGVLQVISASQPLDLRRWGADFLAETFASPVMVAEEKQRMCVGVLDTLKGYLNRKEEMGEEEDPSVVKSAVQCAASIYPLVFRHTLMEKDDSETWGKMTQLKSSILRRMDSAAAGVRVCCIKFVATVVQIQTPGLIADPRRPEQNEISLALVPRDHAVIPPSNLEAEASGLLDRLLGVLQDNTEDAIIATATLNSLSSLVQRRATTSNKILSTIISFNPLKLSNTAMTGIDKVAVKSMTRTTMSFLLNTLKRNPNHTLAGRIQQQVERLRHTLTDVFSDQPSLKRSSPDEPIDGLDSNKRLRLDGEIEQGNTPLQLPRRPSYPPLPSGSVSFAQLWTLNADPRATGFHVEAIPASYVAQLVPPLLASIDQNRLDEALNVVRTRYLEVERRQTHGTGMEEDEDYDPSSYFGNASDQIANQIDQEMPTAVPEVIPRLPAPPPFSEDDIAEFGEVARDRLFGTLSRMDEAAREKKVKAMGIDKEKGFNRIAAGGSQDRDGWITLLTRLATRSSLYPNGVEHIKEENDDRTIAKRGHEVDVPSKLREAFHRYIMDDWRRRIDVAIAWLNEEWYADRVLAKESETETETSLPNYTHHTLRLLDSLIPYLDTKDGRYLIRLLSEIPYLPPETFDRIQKIALDPERVQLSTQALLYLIMLKPPVREAAIDCAADMWRTNVDAKASVTNVLVRWRPEVLEEGKGEEMKEEG